MNSAFRKYYFVLFCAFTAIVSACSVGNKVIPDPTGGIVVDTTGTLGSFTIIVTGDTSFNAVIKSDTSSLIGNVIVNDSLQIIGLETNSVIIFSTFNNTPGTYYTETAPPGITSAVFLYQLKVGAITKRYLMPHGKIVITENDVVNRIIKGYFDVNNEFVSSADKTLFVRANFVLRYLVK